MGSPNEGAFLLNETPLKSFLSLGLLLPWHTPNVLEQEYTWKPALLLCPILGLFSTSRSFAHTGVVVVTQHNQAPSIPGAHTTPANSCPLATLRPTGVCSSSTACSHEDSPQGRSLLMHALEGTWVHLGRGFLCPWYADTVQKGRYVSQVGPSSWPHGFLLHREGWSRNEPLMRGSQSKSPVA